MRIGIEINGVLRDTLGKIEQTYQKFLIDKTDGIEDDESFEYKMTYPINSLTLNEHFSFPDDDELYSFLFSFSLIFTHFHFFIFVFTKVK